MLILRRIENTGYANLVFVLATLLMTSGCATYRHRVSDDFRDAVKLNVGVGFGFYAHAKATSFLDAGLGWGGYWRNIGLENRYIGFAHESIDGCPFPIGVIPGAIPDESWLTSLRMANVRSIERSDVKDDNAVVGQLFDAKAITQWDAYGVNKRSAHLVFNNGEPSFTEQPCGFEAGVGVVFLNVSVGFDPVEFSDLLCTMCGWDLLHDNIVIAQQGSASGSQSNGSVTNQPPSATDSHR